jgi:hypothetical protein
MKYEKKIMKAAPNHTLRANSRSSENTATSPTQVCSVQSSHTVAGGSTLTGDELGCKLHNSMERNPSLKANSRSASQVIYRLL